MTWGISIAISAGAAAFLMASAPIIGMTSAQNGVTLDNAKVAGTATIFDGSTVQSEGFSRIHLNNGTRLDFAAGSKAQLFATHATLSAGMTELQSANFEVDAKFVKVRPSGADAIARVKIDNEKVYVTALTAPVSVSNGLGMLVAKVAPGVPMAFTIQDGASMGQFKGTGCIVNKGGIALLSDDNTKVLSQLLGNLKTAIGSELEVTGTIDTTLTPAGGATQVVHVTGLKLVKLVKKGACGAVATALGASVSAVGLGAAATAGAAGAAGAAAGPSTAVVAGVAVAGATAAGIGGAAAAGAFSTPSPE